MTHDEAQRDELIATCDTPSCPWMRIYSPASPDAVRRASDDLWNHDVTDHLPDRTGLRLLNPCPGRLRRHQPAFARAA